MKTILIVDDYDSIRKGLKLLLESSQDKYKVLEAANGSMALSLLKNETADLAVVDLMMPEMDGFTLSQELQDTYPDIPIIILTAKADQQTKDKVEKQIKPKAFVSKPIDNAKFLQTIESILK
jgi:two-component system OmpR family response regulator